MGYVIRRETAWGNYFLYLTPEYKDETDGEFWLADISKAWFFEDKDMAHEVVVERLVDCEVIEVEDKLFNMNKTTKESQHIDFDLNPNKDTDTSKVNLRLDPEKGVRIKWHDCGESISNYIKADQTGLAKLERMILALELSKKHILKLIKNGTEV